MSRAPKGMEPCEFAIKITNRDGSDYREVTLQGWRIGQFGVAAFAPGEWTVTHIPTGRGLMIGGWWITEKRYAVELARMAHEAVGDQDLLAQHKWAQKTLADVRRQWDR